MRKIIVTGGRDYNDYGMIDYVIGKLKPEQIAVGDCPTGLDSYIREQYGSICKVYAARWTELGRPAGPIRNKEMVEDNEDADFLVAFPGNRGTNNCVSCAKQIGIPVLKVEV